MSFLKQLELYIMKAFRNEDSFLKHFELPGTELLECYMASGTTYVKFLIVSGPHSFSNTASVSTLDFIAWSEGVK
jgi:hypothetical protein